MHKWQTKKKKTEKTIEIAFIFFYTNQTGSNQEYLDLFACQRFIFVFCYRWVRFFFMFFDVHIKCGCQKKNEKKTEIKWKMHCSFSLNSIEFIGSLHDNPTVENVYILSFMYLLTYLF